MSTLHFWPEDIANDLPASPLTILKEAAVELGQATKGAIEAEVNLNSSASGPEKVAYDFVLNVKAIGFKYVLLRVSFRSTSFYPAQISNGEGVDTYVNDDGAMRDNLIAILHAEATASTVKTLLAQSIAA